MATRKTLIVEKYGALEVELRKYLSAELFPSLDTVDVCDLVYLITITFIGVDSEEQYRVKIRELLDSHGVKVEEAAFGVVAPLIAYFVGWLKKL